MEHATPALIFPETVPSSPAVMNLLIFFSALSYYMPTESAGATYRDNNLINTLCREYAPAPLGDDLDRFNRLLREMELSRPDELSRLFSAAKAPMAPGKARDQDEISTASVYSALNKDAEKQTSIRYKERLWQARLILKLAEMLDRREAEVRQGLALVSSAEQKIFASLEGLGEAGTSDLSELSSLNKLRSSKADDNQLHGSSLRGSGMLLNLRVKAWAELYLADSQDFHPLILATANPESGAILLDGFENTWRQDPIKLFSLSMPAVDIPDMEEVWEQYLTSRKIFLEAAEKNMGYFARFLKEIACSAGSAPLNLEKISLLAENVSAWEKKVKIHFPGKETGFSKLDFFCFPGISFTELFQRLFHLEGPLYAHKPKSSTALLAILNK